MQASSRPGLDVRRSSRQPRVLPWSWPGCMGVGVAATAARSARDGAGQIERESAMKWIKPAFDEIKMDAEAKSYSGEGFEE